MPQIGKNGLPTHEVDLSSFDYETDKFDNPILIGAYEPGYTIMDTMELGSYYIGDRYMGISDPVWGELTLGDNPHDAVLLELARTPLFRRSQAIEQLTLGPNYETMPNAMYFSRWQHIWGSLTFVRKMTEGDERFNERERMVLQLRTLVSDLGHTAFSHLGDWLFQGVDNGDDLHDQELRALLENTGIAEVLVKHGFSVEEVAFPEVEDWVECPSPALCVDRVDYGLRELLRWADSTFRFSDYKQMLHNPKVLFEIDKNLQLVVKDQRFAQIFAAGYGILPTEHWGHPVQNVQLYLLENAVKSVLVNNIILPGEHPRDAMFGIDADFEGYFRIWNNMQFDKIMRDVAYSQRFIFATARRYDLENVFRQADDTWRFPEFPDVLTPYSWQSEEHGGPYAAQVEISEADVCEHALRVAEKGIEVALPKRKARSIDPPNSFGT